MQHLASLKVQCLVFLIHPNLENNLVLRKVHLEYLSELLKASLKTPCLALMKEVLNATHLAHLKENLKESRSDLYLDLRITLLMVIYYELQRVLRSGNVMA